MRGRWAIEESSGTTTVPLGPTGVPQCLQTRCFASGAVPATMPGSSVMPGACSDSTARFGRRHAVTGQRLVAWTLGNRRTGRVGCDGSGALPGPALGWVWLVDTTERAESVSDGRAVGRQRTTYGPSAIWARSYATTGRRGNRS